MKKEQKKIQKTSLSKKIDKLDSKEEKKAIHEEKSVNNQSKSPNIKEGKVENNRVRNKNLKAKKSIYLGVAPRIVIMLIAIFILSVLFKLCLNNAVNFKKENSITYNSNSNVNYKVFLKDNDYYDTSYLDAGRQYITNIIDYIDVNFDYKFNVSDNSNIKYKYYIVGNLLITERGSEGKILYDKEEILLAEKTVTKDDLKNINVLENFKVDYSKYNDLVTSFKSKYVLSVDSQFLLTLHVDVISESANIIEKITDTQELIVSIPLSEQTIQIKTDYNEAGVTNTVTEYTDVKIINTIYFVLSLICIILMVVVVMFLMEFLNKIMVKKSLYTKKMKKILKEYDRVIVILKKIPNINGLNVIEINSFDELLDARESLGKPILLAEINKNQKSWFMILDGKEIYRYVLKASDLDNNEKI